MRALSVWQPYASLLATREKRHETRSWHTNYRGYLLIHATRGVHSWQRAVTEELNRTLVRGGKPPLPAPLPRGAIVALSRLVDVFQTEDRGEGSRVVDDIDRCYGDWSPNRFAWRFELVHVVDPPIACAGRQGLWTPTPRVVKAVLSQMRGQDEG